MAEWLPSSHLCLCELFFARQHACFITHSTSSGPYLTPRVHLQTVIMSFNDPFMQQFQEVCDNKILRTVFLQYSGVITLKCAAGGSIY